MPEKLQYENEIKWDNSGKEGGQMAEMAECKKDIEEVTKKIIEYGFLKGSIYGYLEILKLNDGNDLKKN